MDIYYVPYEWSAKTYGLNQFKAYRGKVEKKMRNSMFDFEYIISLIFDYGDTTKIIACEDEIFTSYTEAREWVNEKRERLERKR